MTWHLIVVHGYVVVIAWKTWTLKNWNGDVNNPCLGLNVGGKCA